MLNLCCDETEPYIGCLRISPRELGQNVVQVHGNDLEFSNKGTESDLDCLYIPPRKSGHV